MCFKLTLTISLTLLLTAASAMQLPSSFEATYLVTRGGKPTGEQQTQFKHEPNHQFSLSDVTRGTHGLASFSGFKRTEKTRFSFSNNQITAISHDMQQKVAFSRKSYQFSARQDEPMIQGQAKKPFLIQSNIKPISSHLLPVWLSAQACNGVSHISIPVLKSDSIKTYEFKVQPDDAGLYRADRVYPPNSKKSSQIWFDKHLSCFPIKAKHQNEDDPAIETNLIEHRFLTPNQ